MESASIVKLAAAGLILFLSTSLAFSSCARVEEGTRGVKLTFGAADEAPLDPGLHVKAPFVTQVRAVDVKQRKFEQETMASTKDQQMVQTTVAVNYRASPEAAVTIYSGIGQAPETWEATIFAPHIQEILKSVTARYTALELIIKRPEVKQQITETLTERITAEHFVVEQVSITNFQFSNTYMEAIEAKQVAEQEAQRAQNELDRNALDVKKLEQQAAAEKAAAITKAEGVAEGLRIRAEAEADYHRQISEAATATSLRHAEISRWNGKTPLYVGEAGMMLPAGATSAAE